ncbi:MAG: hypothetical protein SVR04_13945, partial [Spirochaetota bacterium]|nr:hypothetical protein [Spirochaetota bacterium]
VIGEEIIPCYRLESDTPGWNSITHWPEEALAILGFNSIEVAMLCRPGSSGPKELDSAAPNTCFSMKASSRFSRK